MSLTVTLVSSLTSCVDVRWSSSTSYVLPTSSSSQHSCYLVSVASSDSAARREWAVVVRDSKTSAIRFDLEQSGIVGTPMVTVRRCCVNRSVHGEEHWKVEQVGKSSGSASGTSTGYDPLESLFSRLSFSPRPTSPSAAASESVPATVVRLLAPRSSYPAASESVPATVVRLLAPRSSYQRVRVTSHDDQEFVSFDVTVHREKYHKAAVSWNSRSYHQQPDKWQVKLENLTPSTSQSELIYLVNATTRRVEFDVTLKAGHSYRVTITALRLGSGLSHVDNYCSIGTGQTQFKAVLTLDDLTALRDKAKIYSRNNTFCHVLYRNKSPQYFSDMFTKDAGIMKVYVKDNSGDPASPINGQIDGLFFMAEVEPGSTTGIPYQRSAFGSTRLIVPVDVLLNMAPQLYFADFYCMRGRFHYITLVMTRPRSTADDFCREHLLPLSIYDEQNNPFLFRRAGTVEMRVAEGVKVEVLFTENIDVNDMRRRLGATIVENIPLIGKGSSTPGGLRKNPYCHVCNLRPPYVDLFTSDTF